MKMGLRTGMLGLLLETGIACLLLTLPAQGQTSKRAKWFDVRGWNVEIEVTVDSFYSYDKLPGDDCTLAYYSEHRIHTQSRITGLLDVFERFLDKKPGGEDSGRWYSESCRGSGSTLDQSLLREKVMDDGGCQDNSNTMTIQGSGQDPDPHHVELHIDAAKGTYSFGPPQVEWATTREYRGKDDQWTDHGTSGTSPNYAIHDQPLPGGAVMVLSGTHRFDTPPQASTGESIQVSWRLVPVGMQEVELVVDPVGYSEWIPTGGKTEETPGNQIVLKVSLQTKDGKPLQNKAVQFQYDLLDTSRLTGVCGNFPDAGDPALDYKLDQGQNRELKISQEGQHAESAIGEYTAGQVVVSSYDYGGWCRVKVTARLQNGEEVVGYLKGDRSQKEIRLPKRSQDSHIAEAWKKQEGVEAQADYEDLDDTPELDGHKGDGLSLFEEYRGFMEAGTFFRGKPKEKELFVVDHIGGRSKDGIALFVGATRLLVHHKLLANEADYDGVVNSNKRGNIPHLADKWAIRLESIPDKIGYSFTQGTTGGPKTVTISADIGPGPEGWNRTWHRRITTDTYAATLAHEMLHACGVSHHGESDLGKVEWDVEKDDLGLDAIVEYTLNKWGARLAAKRPVRIFKENGVELGPRNRELLFPMKIYVANRGGQHSGVEDCLMRYDAAEAYVPAGDASIRYLIDEPELVGIGLCRTTGGTGVNDPGRQPRSRYGDATLGKCLQQVCVNDAVGP